MKKNIFIGLLCAAAIMTMAMTGCANTKEDSASASPADETVVSDEMVPADDEVEPSEIAEPEQAPVEVPEADASVADGEWRDVEEDVVSVPA